MSNKNLTIGLVVVLVIAIIGIVLPRAITGRVEAVTNLTTNLPNLGVNILGVGPGCDQNLSTCAGSSPGTTGISIVGGLNLNGVLATSTRITMTNATSTPCATLVTATSSLDMYTVNIASSTSVTATTYTLSTSTTAFATSTMSFTGASATPFSYFGYATSTLNSGIGQQYLTATTTVPASSYASLIFKPTFGGALIFPNTWVVLGAQGGLGTFGTTAQVGGSCQLSITQI